MKEKTITSKEIYKCHFLRLFEDKVELPDGNEAERVYVKHDGAAAVLPITKDGKIILTKQYRYPVHKVSIEIPAGKKDDPNEVGFDCAKRELEEETGYQSNDIRKVYDIHNCIAYSNEMIELFIAYDCYKVDNPLESDPDEFIEAELFTVDEVKQLLLSNEITDVKTMLMIQHYLLSR